MNSPIVKTMPCKVCLIFSVASGLTNKDERFFCAIKYNFDSRNTHKTKQFDFNITTKNHFTPDISQEYIRRTLFQTRHTFAGFSVEYTNRTSRSSLSHSHIRGASLPPLIPQTPFFSQHSCCKCTNASFSSCSHKSLWQSSD